MGLFSSHKQAPERVPTDRIIPLGFWNDLLWTRAISLDITLAFNDVLDPEKLRDSLDILLQKEGWQKFGARLRRNKDQKLEYHIPEEFDAKRPAFLFSTIKHDKTVSEHPGFAQLTMGNCDKPTIYGPFQSLRPLLCAEDAPESLNDWIYSDIPQLAIHVVVLKDATFLTITFMHTLMDAMGFTSLLRGWTAVLRGQEDQIPPVLDPEVDPVATIHQKTLASEYVLADRILKGWNFFLFVALYLFDLLWWRKDEERMIFVPGSYLKELRDTALVELKAEPSNATEGKETPFISESDVLLSWWTRTFVKALNLSPNRPISLMNVFDIRGVLAQAGILPSTDAAVVGNITWPTVTLTTAGEVLGKPLSHLASRIRHTIDTHRTMEQVEAIAAIQRDSYEKNDRPAIIGDGGALLLTCSNWHKGKLFQMDFSPAVVKEGVPDSERANLKGRPRLIFSNANVIGFSARNSVAVMGKDASGNWWLRNFVRSGLWSRIEKEM